MQSIHPTLASSLYALEKTSRAEQRLGRVVQTGIRVLDGDAGGVGAGVGEKGSVSGSGTGGIFRSGVVVGVGGVGELHRRSQQLIHNLIATHLLDTHLRLQRTPASQTSPQVFILEPPTTPSAETALLHIYELLEAKILQSQKQQNKASSRTTKKTDQDVDVDTLVDRIALLPYFDLVGISQGLSEISDSLHRSHKQQPNTDSPQSIHNNSTDASNSNTVIVLLRGLPEILATLASKTSTGTEARSAVRTGIGIGTGMNTSQPAALLTEVTRQLRRLAQISNTNRDAEILILVEVGVAIEEVNTGTGTGSSGHHALRLRSAFSSIDGRSLTLGLGSDAASDVGSTTTAKAGKHSRRRYGYVHDVLVRVLEEKFDTIVVVHDGFGIAVSDEEKREAAGQKCIVEVTKDRLGDMVGVWSVWEDGV